jgi:hypothetical protein
LAKPALILEKTSLQPLLSLHVFVNPEPSRSNNLGSQGIGKFKKTFYMAALSFLAVVLFQVSPKIVSGKEHS